jgi:hypothetical protein
VDRKDHRAVRWCCRRLNVTKGATSYPTMVKTSSLVQNGLIPSSWDITNPATLATENILQAMDGQITDACQLGSDLIIYGQREAWRMHADGSIEVFSYTKLSSAKGVLNTNCSIELDGKNLCFGIDDIWMHDGISEKSLCDEKTRDFIFGSLNISMAEKCFVQFNPRLNEVMFGYVSGDPAHEVQERQRLQSRRGLQSDHRILDLRRHAVDLLVRRRPGVQPAHLRDRYGIL